MRSSDLEDVLSSVGILLSILLFVWLIGIVITILVAEEHCLEQGYPETMVTYSYDVYCLNMEGAVTYKVDKQN
jgi:hypothetical protein